MTNTYKHSEMAIIVRDFLKSHSNAIITVRDSKDSSYEDTIGNLFMFCNDYCGAEYTRYYKNPSEIVVVLA